MQTHDTTKHDCIKTKTSLSPNALIRLLVQLHYFEHELPKSEQFFQNYNSCQEWFQNCNSRGTWSMPCDNSVKSEVAEWKCFHSAIFTQWPHAFKLLDMEIASSIISVCAKNEITKAKIY